MTGARRAMIAAVMVLVSAIGAWGQEKRVVAVGVVDEQGRQVTGLTAENFRGRFRGQEVKIVSAEWETGRRRIVIVVDQSNSMFWANRWEVARMAVEDLVAAVPQGNGVALVLFSTAGQEVIGFEGGRQAIEERLWELEKEKKALEKAGSRTPLFDGIIAGVELLEPRKLGDALFVVSDGGGDNASKNSLKAVRERVFCSKARVYFLLLLDPDRSGRGPEYVSGPALAKELAEGSGGTVLIPRGHPAQYLGKKQQEEMAGALRWLYEQIQSFYVVEVEPPASVNKTRDWKLEIVVGAGKKRKDVTVVYPKKVAACGEKGN